MNDQGMPKFTGWQSKPELIREYIFDDDAHVVCHFIMADTDFGEAYRFTLQDGPMTGEFSLLAHSTPEALYSIEIGVSVRIEDEFSVQHGEIGVSNARAGRITLEPVRANECKALLFIESNPQLWQVDGSPYWLRIGKDFVSTYWNHLIAGWLLPKAGFIQTAGWGVGNAPQTRLEPWEQITDHLWDRQALELWHKGHSCPEIATKIGQAEKTVRNRFTQLRYKHGRAIVPTDKDRRQKPG